MPVKPKQTDEVVETTADEAPPPEEDQEIQDPAAILEQNRKTNTENKKLRERLKAAEEELEKLRLNSLSEQEKAIEAARLEGKREAEAASNEKLLKLSVRAQAAGVLEDPDDAWRFIDFAEGFDPEDSEGIDGLIQELLQEKPYLASSKLRQRPNIDQGPQGPQPQTSSGNDWLRSVVGGRR